MLPSTITERIGRSTGTVTHSASSFPFVDVLPFSSFCSGDADGTSNSERNDRIRLAVRVLTPALSRPPDLVAAEIRELLDVSGADLSHASLHFAPSIQAAYEEKVLQIQTEIRLNRSAQQPIEAAAADFASQWCSCVLGLAEQSHLQFAEPLVAFATDCIPVQRRIPISAVSLGNLLNFGSFAEHRRFVARRDRGGNFSFVADFEHDKKVLTLKLRMGEQIGYKLVLGYTAIHCIIADCAWTDNCTQQQLFLLLRWPPQLWKKIPNVRERTNRGGGMMNLDERRDFVRVSEMDNNDCSSSVLGGCSALCLSFPFVSFARENNFGFASAAPKPGLLFFRVLGRLRSRTKLPVNFAAVAKFPASVLGSAEIVLPQVDQFPVRYALQALLSRGFIVTDQLRTSEKQNVKMPLFLQRLEHCCRDEKEDWVFAQRALEQMLAAIDERKQLNLLSAFELLYQIQNEEGSEVAGQMGGALDPVDVPGGCCLVRKVIATPTRQVFLPPEVLLGNRVLRNWGEEFALRLSFRDDDGRKLTQNLLGQRDEGRDLVRRLVRDKMNEGVSVGGRHYRFLAWSNSQLRDHGA